MNPDEPPPTSTASFPVLERFFRIAEVPESRSATMRFSSRRYPGIVDFLAPYGPFQGRTILDLGGGVGGLSVVLHERFGGRYDVADFAPFPPRAGAELAEFGVRSYLRADLSRPEGLDGLPTGYDGILFVEVLEHLLVDPVRLFRRIGEHLSPSGWLLLTTPNQARLRSRFRLLLGRSIRETGLFPDQEGISYGHVMEYTLADLAGFLERSGLVLAASTIVQNPPGRANDRLRRWGTGLLNRPSIRTLALGDDLVLLARRAPATAPPPHLM